MKPDQIMSASKLLNEREHYLSVFEDLDHSGGSGEESVMIKTENQGLLINSLGREECDILKNIVAARIRDMNEVLIGLGVDTDVF